MNIEGSTEYFNNEYFLDNLLIEQLLAKAKSLGQISSKSNEDIMAEIINEIDKQPNLKTPREQCLNSVK